VNFTFLYCINSPSRIAVWAVLYAAEFMQRKESGAAERQAFRALLC
jgi:hypothetical protein